MAYLASHSAVGSGTDDVVLNRPAGTADGHQLAYCIESYAETVTWGFTPAASGTFTVDGSHTRAATWAWATKVAASEPATRTISIGGAGGADVKGIVVCLSGRTSAAPTPQGTNDAGNGASPVSAPLTGVTAASGDDIVIFFGCGSGNASGTWVLTAPTDYTLRETATDTGAFFGGGLGATTRDNVSAGATGTLTGTWTLAANSGESAGVVLAFAASGGGGGVTAKPLLLRGVG